MATRDSAEHGVGGEHDVVAEAGREGAEHDGAHDAPSTSGRHGCATRSRHDRAAAPHEHACATGTSPTAPVRRRAARTAPPRAVEGSALTQPLDDDLELVAEEKSAGRADPRDEGVHAGTLTDGPRASADRDRAAHQATPATGVTTSWPARRRDWRRWRGR